MFADQVAAARDPNAPQPLQELVDRLRKRPEGENAKGVLMLDALIQAMKARVAHESPLSPKQSKE